MLDLALDLHFRYPWYAMLIVEHENFCSAAYVLNPPQSAISRRIQSIEYRLYVSFCERSRTVARLTQSGESSFAMQALVLNNSVRQ